MGDPDGKGWIPFERETHRRLPKPGQEPGTESGVWCIHRTPFAVGQKCVDLTHDCRAIDWRITQPITVSLSEYEMPRQTALSFVNDPVGHQAATSKKRDDRAHVPRVVLAGADTDACAVRDCSSHTRAAQIRKDRGRRPACHRTQSRKSVTSRRPTRTCYKIARQRDDAFLAHLLRIQAGRGALAPLFRQPV